MVPPLQPDEMDAVFAALASEPRRRILDVLKREKGLLPVNPDRAGETGWSVLDYLDVVCHVFTEDARQTYSARGIDKRRLHRELVIRDNLCMGKLFLNKILYNSGLRSLAPMRRYAVDDVDSQGRVRLVERREYKEFQRDLASVAAGLNNRFRDYIMSYQMDADTAGAMQQVLARHAQAAKNTQGL